MAKEKRVEITVTTMFTGKQDRRQAFIKLILGKRKSTLQSRPIDVAMRKPYNPHRVFSDVRVE